MTKGTSWVFGNSVILQTGTVLAALLVLTAGVRTAARQSQVFSAPKAQIENVSFEQMAGGVFNIYYDLSSDAPNAAFRVSIQVSDDGGKTFTLTPAAISGDVENVKPGRRKKIVWQSGQDIGAPLSINQLKFNVVATAGDTRPESGAPPASAAAKPKGNPMKWIIPIAGGGAAAAAIAVSHKSGPGPTIEPPPQVCTITLSAINIAQPPDKGFGLQAATTFELTTNAPTDSCNSPVTVKWDFGDGATATGLDVNHMYQTSSTFNVKITATDASTGSAGPVSQAITVMPLTGTWTGTINTSPAISFTMQLLQDASGTGVGGTYTDKNGTGTVARSTLGDPRNVSLIVGQGARTIDFSCKVDANMKVCSGTVNNAYTATMSMTRQ